MVRTVSLAFADWPEADRQMWTRLTHVGSPLDARGRLSHLRGTTLRSLQVGYERWIWWVLNQRPEAIAEEPAQRATPERLIVWLEGLQSLAPKTRHTLVQRTIIVLSAARPDLDWTVQLRIVSRAERLARHSPSPRKMGRILPSSDLLSAGKRLASDVADAEPTALCEALAVRNGAMVALLALLPMRLRSFSELALGTSVLLGADRIHIALSPDMTKNGMAWEANVPEAALSILRRYLAETRPWLMVRRGPKHHDKLWVDRCGEPLKSHSIMEAIVASTLKMTGVRVPPHFFRDAAATTLSRLSPENARLIRPLLAHSGFGTAERHYIQAQGIETGRDYAAVLAELMEDK